MPLRSSLRLKPEDFHGRNDLVEVLRIGIAQLQEETSRICILGSGWMEKTSVSLAAVESKLSVSWRKSCLGALYCSDISDSDSPPRSSVHSIAGTWRQLEAGTSSEMIFSKNHF